MTKSCTNRFARARITSVVLVRHAAAQTDGRLCGSLDLPLSAEGTAQLERMLQKGTNRTHPDALYTSTLGRATRVAERLAGLWSVEPRPAPWAREIDCGRFEGSKFIDIQQGFPGLWARHEAQADDAFAWPGGESYREFRTRILIGMTEMTAAHLGGRVSLVTHAGVISQLLGAVRGRAASCWAPDRPKPLTATEILWQDGRPIEVLRFDDPDWL